MQTIIWVAMLISSFLGSDFHNEWACWEDMTVQPTAEYRYYCEYSGIENGGTYAAVWSDGNAVKTYIEFNQ
jgi:hypothetical protein